MFETDTGESAHAMNGVPGRMFWGRVPGAALWTTQKWVSERRSVKGKEWGDGALIVATVRFDDSCKNGHQSFAVTADIYKLGRETLPGRRAKIELGGGCCHKEIAAAFPELAHLIHWHLCDTSGPMHYVANTVYHAGDRDHWGLRKDERCQIKNGRTGALAWHLCWIDSGVERPIYEMPKQTDGDKPEQNPVVEWRPWCHVGEGKARELDAARSSAVWPEATDADLTQEPDALKAALEVRLPALIAAMRADVVAAGFEWKESSK